MSNYPSVVLGHEEQKHQIVRIRAYVYGGYMNDARLTVDVLRPMVSPDTLHTMKLILSEGN